MPTWRTTLGRALTPGKTPHIGQARELPIPGQGSHAIPWRDDLAVRPVGDPLPVDLTLPTAPVMEGNYAVFDHPGPGSVLTPPDQPDGGGLDLSSGVSLERAYEEASVSEPSDTWDWFLPLLEPPAVGPVPAPQLGGNHLRPYQIEGVRKIVVGRSVLLADEPGLGKTVQAATGVYSLVQRGLVRHALVVCSTSSLRHWLAHLQTWAPGMLVRFVPAGRANDRASWNAQAHVYLTDHAGLIAAGEAEALPDVDTPFDLVVLDDLAGARRQGERLWEAIDRLQAPRRLALAGAPPGSEDFWLSVFGFLFPQPENAKTEVGLMQQLAGPSPITILRRTRIDLGEQLLARTHIESWIDLQGEQLLAYRQAIAEQRRWLAGLGDAVSSEHIQTAVARLVHAACYGPTPVEAAKAMVLIELLEDIAASGLKAFVVVNDPKERLRSLAPAVARFGAVAIDTVEGESLGFNPIEHFRTDSEMHVILGGIDQVDDMLAMPELSYIVHVDPYWNPAVRRSIEDRLRPEVSPRTPLLVYELWSAATVEARLHDFVQEKARFTRGDASAASSLSREDWLQQIIEVGKAASASGAPLLWTADAETQAEVLPDKKLVTGMDPSELTEGVTEFIHALGFPDIEQLFGNSQAGVDLLAWREADGRIERILVRCLTEPGNVGVADARLALDLLDEHPDISRAYLVAVGDFSAAAKRTAEESDGRLELISGGEFARHLRLLGKLTDEGGDPAG